MPQAASSETSAANGADDVARPQRGFWALTLGSIGVVYGDIGTSPLYALREAVFAAGGASSAWSAERPFSACSR